MIHWLKQPKNPKNAKYIECYWFLEKAFNADSNPYPKLNPEKMKATRLLTFFALLLSLSYTEPAKATHLVAADLIYIHITNMGDLTDFSKIIRILR